MYVRPCPTRLHRGCVSGRARNRPGRHELVPSAVQGGEPSSNCLAIVCDTASPCPSDARHKWPRCRRGPIFRRARTSACTKVQRVELHPAWSTQCSSTVVDYSLVTWIEVRCAKNRLREARWVFDPGKKASMVDMFLRSISDNTVLDNRIRIFVKRKRCQFLYH